MVISNLKIGTSYFFIPLKEFAKENIRYHFLYSTFALGIVTPWGGDARSAAPLQERRGGAAGALGAPCNKARPGVSRGTLMHHLNFPNIFLATHSRHG